MSETCRHGQLMRSCDLCEKDAEIARLNAELADYQTGMAAANERWLAAENRAKHEESICRMALAGEQQSRERANDLQAKLAKALACTHYAVGKMVQEENDYLRAELAKYRDDAQPAVPEGYVLAPKEPTKEMLSALVAFLEKGSHFSHPDVRPYNGTANGDDPKAWQLDYYKAMWKAMLAAAREAA